MAEGTPQMVRLDTTIPLELDDALNSLVLISGTSKASLIREGLSFYAVQAGAMLTRKAEEVFVHTPTMGLSRAAARKKAEQS